MEAKLPSVSFKVPIYVEGIKVNLPEDHRKAGCPDDILGFLGRVTLF